MLDWVQLAVVLLQIALKLINWLHDRGMIDEGRRQVLAENAAAIAVKVGKRDELRRQVDAMSEDEVDKELRDLEPPAGGKP